MLTPKLVLRTAFDVVFWSLMILAVGIAVAIPFVARADGGGIGALVTPYIPKLLDLLFAGLVALAGWALDTWRRKTAADSWRAKLLDGVDYLGSKVWDRLEPELRAALADGKITTQERNRLEDAALAVLNEVLSPSGVKAAYQALRLPDPLGLASWLVSKLIPRIAGAHDVEDKSVPNAVQAVYPLELVGTTPAGGVVTELDEAHRASGG